jgi:hypothetical protein
MLLPSLITRGSLFLKCFTIETLALRCFLGFIIVVFITGVFRVVRGGAALFYFRATRIIRAISGL